jgi:hypothetical protein
MSKFFTDDAFAPLAKQLGTIDVDRTFRRGLDVGADIGVDLLREELMADGAPEHVIDAVHVLNERGLSRAVGVNASHPAAQDASDWEYGSPDHSVAAHGTFRLTSPDIAEAVAGETAEEFAFQLDRR